MPRLADPLLERLADPLLDEATADRAGRLHFDLADLDDRVALARIVHRVYRRERDGRTQAEETIARVLTAVTRPDRRLDEQVSVRAVLDAVYGRPDTPLPPGQTPGGSR